MPERPASQRAESRHVDEREVERLAMQMFQATDSEEATDWYRDRTRLFHLARRQLQEARDAPR